MQLRVVTPLGTILDVPAVSVSLWTAQGEIEVLLGHEPLILLLQPGEMRVRDPAGQTRVYAAGEGFARIDLRSVVVFSDMAEDSDGIVLAQAQEAKTRAEKALAEAANMTEDERHEAELALRESLVRIQTTLKRKGGGQPRGPSPTP